VVRRISIFSLLIALLAPAAWSADRVVEFTFKEPAARAYRLLVPHDAEGRPIRAGSRLEVAPDDGGHVRAFGDRVLIGLHPGRELAPLIAGRPLRLGERFAEQVYILKADDALTAAEQAQALAREPAVRFCHPERHAPRLPAGPYARRPDDEHFGRQFYLEAHDDAGLENFISINAREAWGLTMGQGVVIAVGDTGADLQHPDLLPATIGQAHFNFEDFTTNSNHAPSDRGHGTAVAGLAAARGYNGIGVAGAAPRASLAIWKMLNQSSEIEIAKMFLYNSNQVSVQNHSWGWGSSSQIDISEVEKQAITNIFLHGRGGRGVILVRAAGNIRQTNPNDGSPFNPVQIAGDANDDGYIHDPHSIAVGAVRATGKAAFYSSPGACVLVAAPGGDEGFLSLATTDRVGSSGFNAGVSPDYAFDGSGFIGTSGATPIIAGVAALIVSANSNLNARDVHQIMALSARQTSSTDTDLQTNGAGLLISHNTGYGVPDAGQAVRLARHWSNRPPRVEISRLYAPTNPVPIPDLGHVLRVTGSNVPAQLLSIPGRFPSESRHEDIPPGEWRPPNLESASVPVTHVGLATNPIGADLTGRAALIERGGLTNLGGFFVDKLDRAREAGAEFAIIYNNDTNQPDDLIDMGLLRPNTYPAIFIGRTLGLQLRDHSATNSTVRVQLVRDGPRVSFNITNQLLVEQVAVRIKVSHPLRRNLRFTLYSPAGTRSRLQRSLVSFGTGIPFHPETALNLNWTYHSVLHLGESSVGQWLVVVGDDEEGNVGTLHEVELFIKGVPIVDSDADGLDDQWESVFFGNLASGPRDDPDRDGYINSREQLMGTRPDQVDPQFQLALDASVFSGTHSRLSWPASAHFQYTVESADRPDGVFTNLLSAPGRFPVAEVFLPTTNQTRRYFRVRATPVQ